MNKDMLKRYLPHLVAIVAFIAVATIYFYPAVNGYQLKQGDITNFKGMAQEIQEFRRMYDEEPLWTNSMFGGMPAYQISVQYPNNVVKMVDKVVTLGLPRPVSYLFLYLLGFYILLISLRVRPAVAAIGAVAFAFSSYFFIILEAGHNTKAHAIAYMAPTLAGIIWAYRGRYLFGGAVTALFLALQIAANHVQITYYFGILVVFVAIAAAVKAYQIKHLPVFAKASATLIIAAVLALVSNMNLLWNTYEYGKYTTRGATELSIKPDGSSNDDIATKGLDRDYITNWSYGKGESFSFLIPDAKGGATGVLGNNPDVMKSVDRSMQSSISQSNRYWGDQPFTSGPVYMGAIVILLFLLGIFFVQSPLKWALLATAILTMALGWGKNLMWLTDFFLDYAPGYDKFRAVTIILAITEFVVPILGFLFLKRLFDEPQIILEQKKKFFAVAGGLAALLGLFLLTPDTFFDFLSQGEKDMLNGQMDGEQAADFMLYGESLIKARMGIFRSDALRSLMFVAGGIALIWLFAKGTIKAQLALGILGVLILVDMWGVNKRYLNNEKDRGRFTQWELTSDNKVAHKANAADLAILQMEQDLNPRVKDAISKAAADLRAQAKQDRGTRISEDEVNNARFAALRFNTNYRVLTLQNPFNDSRVSYFHKSIGGYHGAKLKRYQELIEFKLGDEIAKLQTTLQQQPSLEALRARLRTLDMLNMLNTQYVIYNPQAGPIINESAAGSAWFVQDLIMVANADEEITRLDDFDVREEAIVDQRYADMVQGFSYQASQGANIAEEVHLPNYIKYIYDSPVQQAVIFSEIHYDAGWKAYIDGKETPHFRANYLLRGMIVPAGQHTIEFKFEPDTFITSSQVSTAGGLALVLLFGFAMFRNFRSQVEEDDDDF